MPFKFKVFKQKNALISAQNKNFKQAHRFLTKIEGYSFC
jgi:hypothetical protein